MPIDTARGLVDLGKITASATLRDETAQQQLSLIGAAMWSAVKDPYGAVKAGFEAIDAQLDEAARLEAAGDWQAASEIYGQVWAEYAYAVAGVGTGGASVGVLAIKGVRLLPGPGDLGKIDGPVGNIAGSGKFRPSQPLDASGKPILRTNDRGGVLIRPNGSVTCGQHACGMVLNTQGRPVAVDDIIRSHPPDSSRGSSQTQLQRALRDNGVGNTAFSGRSVEDLGRYTNGGRPAIATVQTGSNTYHAVVVDGVTTRGGQRVVAIRDPGGGINGGVYYETVQLFQNRFTGHVIRMDNE